jgi:hypothetical protein
MLSAEVRQYSLLLLFASANLYFLDYAIECDSWWLMLASAFALWLAILTHYSAYIVAFVLGIYAADRLFRSRSRFTTIAVWVLAQVAAVLLCGALYASHISKLRTQGVSQMIADTWLRMSIFHRGQDHFLNFAFTRTVRLFRFLFTQGTVGFIGVLLFAGALIWLARGTTPSYSLKPTPRQIALLLFLPFCVTLLASLAGVYPYGGTRHDVLLGMFAIPGLSIGITRLIPMKWLRYSAVISGLLVCNLFPSPVPPYIPLRDQQKGNMTAAVQFVTQSAPPGSLIFADHPAGLLLSYYLCGRTVVPFEPQAQPFLRSDCAGYQLITPVQQPWVFQANTFAGHITQIRRIYEAPADSKIVIFQTGWFDSKDPRWLSALARSGCKSPHYFGANVLICEIATGTADA